MFDAKHNALLRKAVEDACGGRTGTSIAGALRAAMANPINGFRVKRTIRRAANGDRLPALWSVEDEHRDEVKKQSSEASPSTSALASYDDDRLMAVLTSAMAERCITGKQADRVLELWCEKGKP